MNTRHMLALLGAWMACFLLLGQPLQAENLREELHSLYKRKDFHTCWAKAHTAAKMDQKSAIPLIYAALAVCHYKEDQRIQRQVGNPWSRVMAYMEEAKRRDPSGSQLTGMARPIGWIQQNMFNGARQAWLRGNEGSRAYFDRMHALFPNREGIWRNIYHAGRNMPLPDYDFQEWDHPFYRLADMKFEYPNLDPEVRDLLYLHNLCRIDPPRFERTFMAQYLESYSRATNEASYIESLHEYLQNLEPRGYLRPGNDLRTAALSHAEDLSKNGVFGHDGSNGETFSQRMDRFSIPGWRRAENVQGGLSEPIDCFFSLLIDFPIESLGHRYNMLEASHKYLGVGIVHKYGNWKIWVFDFSDQSKDADPPS